MESSVPRFKANESRYNLKTYFGRVKDNLDMVDLSNIFISDEELVRSKTLITEFKALAGSTTQTGGKYVLPSGSATDADLWRARKVVQAILHPDTGMVWLAMKFVVEYALCVCCVVENRIMDYFAGEKIPFLGRMAMFMPLNIAITTGMLSATGSSQLVWQWVNQSYNAGFNFANRNASKPIDLWGLGASYAVATSTALSMAYGLGKVVDRVKVYCTAYITP
jgi:hypothetical protein